MTETDRFVYMNKIYKETHVHIGTLNRKQTQRPYTARLVLRASMTNDKQATPNYFNQKGEVYIRAYRRLWKWSSLSLCICFEL